MFEIRKDSFYLDGKPFRVFPERCTISEFCPSIGKTDSKTQGFGYELRGNGNLLEFARVGRR